MRKHPLGLFLIALFLTSISTAVRAEALDDQTIRSIYAQIRETGQDPVKSRQLLEARFDQNYVLKMNIVRVIGSNPPQTTSLNQGRAQAIEQTIQTMGMAKGANYTNGIASIQYSGDRQFAYVNEVTSASGTSQIPAGPKVSAATIAYEAKETCAHVLSLVGETVKIMQSQCDEQIAIRK